MAKIVRFDLLTVLLYLDILLSEIESYAEPWTQKTLLRLGTKARIEVLRQSLLNLTNAHLRWDPSKLSGLVREHLRDQYCPH